MTESERKRFSDLGSREAKGTTMLGLLLLLMLFVLFFECSILDG